MHDAFPLVSTMEHGKYLYFGMYKLKSIHCSVDIILKAALLWASSQESVCQDYILTKDQRHSQLLLWLSPSFRLLRTSHSVVEINTKDQEASVEYSKRSSRSCFSLWLCERREGVQAFYLAQLLFVVAVVANEEIILLLPSSREIKAMQQTQKGEGNMQEVFTDLDFFNTKGDILPIFFLCIH